MKKIYVLILLFLLGASIWKTIDTFGFIRKHNTESIIYITTQKKTLTIEIQDKKSKGALELGY